MYPSISTFLWLNNIPLYGYTTFVYPLPGCWTFVMLGLGVCEPASRTPHQICETPPKRGTRRRLKIWRKKKKETRSFLFSFDFLFFPAPSYQHLWTSEAVYFLYQEKLNSIESSLQGFFFFFNACRLVLSNFLEDKRTLCLSSLLKGVGPSPRKFLL